MINQVELKLPKRKTPVRHSVRSHTRERRPVRSFTRGKGGPRQQKRKQVTVKTWQPGDKIVAFPRFLSKSQDVLGYGFEVRYVAFGVTKGVFDTIVAFDNNLAVGWIRARRGETGNEADIVTAKSHPGKVVKYSRMGMGGIAEVFDPADFYYENVRGYKMLKLGLK